jgi:hypothetical protein
MRSLAESRLRLLARTAALAIAAAALAACSADTSRFAENPFSSPLAARPAPADHTASLPSGRVDTQPLPAPSQPANVASTGAYAAPATSPRLAAAPNRPASAGGIHVVAPGETLTSIARL